MIKKILRLIKNVQQLNITLDYIQQSLGRIEARQLFPVNNVGLQTGHEFKVYSQSGEDGIIQYLINNVKINNKRFIEFGVENYLESNTRFLALNNYWSGLVIDGDETNINFIKNDPIYWRCNLKADCSFITRENINSIFEKNGISGEIGILSIDIDGNDYWVWEAINTVNPAIIIAEYNSFFGSSDQVTVPYNPSFVRTNAHYSKIYYGASIAALTALAKRKGYKLVASNQSGNNVFYVREDVAENLRELSIEEAYRPINFREAHTLEGDLSYLSFNEAKELIADLNVFDIEKGIEVNIKSLR